MVNSKRIKKGEYLLKATELPPLSTVSTEEWEGEGKYEKTG